MKCKNAKCQHNNGDHKCSMKASQIELDIDGKCTSFEKGLLHYIFAVDDAMGGSNMVTVNSLTRDVRLGIFYLMEIYKVGFVENLHGNWRFLTIRDSEENKNLTFEQVLERTPDLEAINRYAADIARGVFPDQEAKPAEPKVDSQPFGWLSPTAVFTEGDFGEHEKVAHEIIRSKGFLEEFKDWRNQVSDTSRDFLADVKGYCLVHNPSGLGGYIVSHTKPLTKKQKDFLYGYFADMGDMFMANQYATE